MSVEDSRGLLKKLCKSTMLLLSSRCGTMKLEEGAQSIQPLTMKKGRCEQSLDKVMVPHSILYTIA